MITWSDISADEDLARQILVQARSIAPCLAGFTPDSEDGKNALAILRGVYKRITKRDPDIRAQRQGPSSVDYVEIASAFSGDATTALRALCTAADPRAGLPVGSFPADRPLSRIWPEKNA